MIALRIKKFFTLPIIFQRGEEKRFFIDLEGNYLEWKTLLKKHLTLLTPSFLGMYLMNFGKAKNKEI